MFSEECLVFRKAWLSQSVNFQQAWFFKKLGFQKSSVFQSKKEAHRRGSFGLPEIGFQGVSDPSFDR